MRSRLFLIAGNLAALIAAAVLVFPAEPAQRTGSLGRPPVQRPGATKSLDVMRYQPDDFVRSRPKLVGGLLVLGSAVRLDDPGRVIR